MNLDNKRRPRVQICTLARRFLAVVLLSIIFFSPFRRCYRAMFYEPDGVAPVQPSSELKLTWASIADLAEGLEKRQFTSEELVNVGIHCPLRSPL